MVGVWGTAQVGGFIIKCLYYVDRDSDQHNVHTFYKKPPNLCRLPKPQPFPSPLFWSLGTFMETDNKKWKKTWGTIGVYFYIFPFFIIGLHKCPIFIIGLHKCSIW